MRPLCQAHAAPSLRRSVFACADAPDRLPSRPHFCFRRRSTRGRLLKLLWVSPVACPVSGSCREARAGTANDTCGQMCRRTAVFAHPWASLEHQSPIDERCRGTTRCARNTHPPTSLFSYSAAQCRRNGAGWSLRFGCSVFSRPSVHSTRTPQGRVRGRFKACASKEDDRLDKSLCTTAQAPHHPSPAKRIPKHPSPAADT